jgi:hypothetical protein
LHSFEELLLVMFTLQPSHTRLQQVHATVNAPFEYVVIGGVLVAAIFNLFVHKLAIHVIFDCSMYLVLPGKV